uniref:Uncharacterized protein n=1 Tax=Heterorhabditis bacteriophora TaxID=37862 RepID=A0A1I7XBC1_HETBA
MFQVTVIVCRSDFIIYGDTHMAWNKRKPMKISSIKLMQTIVPLEQSIASGMILGGSYP